MAPFFNLNTILPDSMISVGAILRNEIDALGRLRSNYICYAIASIFIRINVNYQTKMERYRSSRISRTFCLRLIIFLRWMKGRSYDEIFVLDSRYFSACSTMRRTKILVCCVYTRKTKYEYFNENERVFDLYCGNSVSRKFKRGGDEAIWRI